MEKQNVEEKKMKEIRPSKWVHSQFYTIEVKEFAHNFSINRRHVMISLLSIILYYFLYFCEIAVFASILTTHTKPK